MNSAIKKNILLLSVMIILIALFGLVLGKTNIGLAMIVIFISFIFIGKDLTGSLSLNVIKIFILVFTIGAFTYVANLDIYLGLIVNLIGIFIITYIGTYNANAILTRPFLMAYILLLNSNFVNIEDVFMEFLAIFICAVFAMLLRYLLNGDKGSNITTFRITKVINLFKGEIGAIKDKSKVGYYSRTMEDNIEKWNKEILQRRDSYFSFTTSEEVQLNMMGIIGDFQEALKIIEKQYKEDNSYKAILNDLYLFIDNLDKNFKKKNNRKELDNNFGVFYEKYKVLINSDYIIFNLFRILERLIECIEENYKEKEKYIYKNDILKIRKTEKFFMLWQGLKIDSIRFTFAFKAAVLLGLFYFIINLFNIVYGQWIMISVAITIIAYFDFEVKDYYHRILGAIIGGAIFFVVFSFASSWSVKAMVILIAFYLMNVVEEEYLKVAASALLILGIFTINSYGAVSSLYTEMLYYIIGIFIGIIGSLVVFPYNVRKGSKLLIKNYNSLVKNALEKIKDENEIEINKLYVSKTLDYCRAIENKIQENNWILCNEDIDEFIREERNILNNLYMVIHSLEKEKHESSISILRLREYILEEYKDIDSIDNIKIYMEKELSTIDSVRVKDKYLSICKLYLDNKRLEKFISIRNLFNFK